MSTPSWSYGFQQLYTVGISMSPVFILAFLCISWNNPAENCMNLLAIYASQMRSSLISISTFKDVPFQVSPACRITQRNFEEPMILQDFFHDNCWNSAALFAKSIRFMRSSSWWTFSLCLARARWMVPACNLLHQHPGHETSWNTTWSLPEMMPKESDFC